MDQSQFEDDNSQFPDEAQDIAPRFHHNKEDDDDDDDEGENLQMKSTWGEGWTARKWSALLLDHLSVIYAEEMLQHVLPTIEERLLSRDWEVKESAILVLGAIAQGCSDGLEQYMPGVLEMLINLCDDKKVMRRSSQNIYKYDIHK